MNLFLWIVQGILAVIFLLPGIKKAFQARKVKESVEWAKNVSVNSIQAVGWVEILGAAGIVLPWALNIAPILTPLAALGLALTMVIAVLLERKNAKAVTVSLVTLILCLIVMFGRF